MRWTRLFLSGVQSETYEEAQRNRGGKQEGEEEKKQTTEKKKKVKKGKEPKNNCAM